jgi:hypothetical protein
VSEQTLEAALKELKAMFPDCGILLDVDLWDNLKCEQGGAVSGSHAWVTISANKEGVMDADFSGDSLADVMRKIREHAPNIFVC